MPDKYNNLRLGSQIIGIFRLIKTKYGLLYI